MTGQVIDLPTNSPSHQTGRTEELSGDFDYIVCGAGTAGCVAAARLAENPDIKVLLIEAGGMDDSDLIADPNRWPQTLATALDWGFRAEANPRLGGRAIAYSMGKVLGGGSSINVSTWSRGHRADWDAYATASGDDAWAYEQVLDLYRRRIEAWAGAPDPQFRGLNGPVHVQPAANPHPFAYAVLDAAVSAGVRRYPNANGEMMEATGGCALIDETVRDGQRRSMFQSYIRPLLMHDNLKVLTDTTVARIVLQGGRARAVECRHDGQPVIFQASQEIILSLGAISTPKVLMLSGIGDADHLRSLGLPVVLHSPGVGRNLHDHVAIGCVWETDDQTLPPIPRSQTAIFWKTEPGLDSPNFYAYSRRGPDITPENTSSFRIPPQTWSFVVGMRPHSRGAVYLTGTDIASPVRIDTGYLSDPRDLGDLTSGLAVARQIGNAAALGRFTKREIAPGSIDAESLRRYFSNGLGTFWHQSGTARMGRDLLSVVDGRLRVHGISALRIADASVMPRVTSGNTMAPCVVIGEQVARFVRGAAEAPRASAIDRAPADGAGAVVR